MKHFSRVSLIGVPSLGLLLTCSLSCALPPADPQREIENLRAFARLYGYVRFFHPSDEASEIDWDRFAVHGVAAVQDAKSSGELRTKLSELFSPIAPTVQIFSVGERPQDSSKSDMADVAASELVAWQHLGVGLGSQSSIYRSIRTNRDNEVDLPGPGFGTVTQAVDAVPFRGLQIRLRAFVRVEVTGPGNRGQLWLRVDREEEKRGFFDNMDDRPITSKEWRRYEIVGGVAEDAQRIFFGGFLRGSGQLWFDDFELQVRESGGEWRPIVIGNPGFELSDEHGVPAIWFGRSTAYEYRVNRSQAHSGEASLRISRHSQAFRGTLFDAYPDPGESVEKELGAGIVCIVPLTHQSDSIPTSRNREGLDSLKSLLNGLDLADSATPDESVRLAAVAILWNVFQHFYPYFDVVETNWDEALTWALGEALDDQDGNDFFGTLQSLVARLQDGHGRVDHAAYRVTAGLPFLVSWVENQVVATFSNDPRILRGDVIVSLDGKPAAQVLAADEPTISGSPQWKRWRGLQRFGGGTEGSQARLVVRRSAETLEVELKRTARDGLAAPIRTSIEQVEEGVFYVDLSRASMPEIRERLAELAQARGVVFDLRGYPKGNHEVISHLLTEPDTSRAWMRVPQIIYPDREKIAGYQEHGWGLVPKKPHIEGKVVFLTDGRAISYAESFMSFVEHYALAEIVGQPTAGANGNVNVVRLPGGFTVSWTGMKVVKHDGSQHHLIGILPTVPAERTIRGVAEGRDELLDIALDLAR